MAATALCRGRRGPPQAGAAGGRADPRWAHPRWLAARAGARRRRDWAGAHRRGRRPAELDRALAPSTRLAALSPPASSTPIRMPPRASCARACIPQKRCSLRASRPSSSTPTGAALSISRHSGRACARSGIGVNVAPLVGHGAIRGSVMGGANRAPTTVERDRMRDAGPRGDARRRVRRLERPVLHTGRVRHDRRGHRPDAHGRGDTRPLGGPHQSHPRRGHLHRGRARRRGRDHRDRRRVAAPPASSRT